MQQYHLVDKKLPDVTNANCWAHARRDFADAVKAADKKDPSSVRPVSYTHLDVYKRQAYSWPRNTSEALEITPQQYRLLMEGCSIVAKHPITELTNPPKGL